MSKTASCLRCGRQFNPRNSRNVYCCKRCAYAAAKERFREHYASDPEYREKVLSAKRRDRHLGSYNNGKVDEFAKRAVAALDEDTKLGLSLLLEYLGNGFSRELLDRYYEKYTLEDVLREIDG